MSSHATKVSLSWSLQAGVATADLEADAVECAPPVAYPQFCRHRRLDGALTSATARLSTQRIMDGFTVEQAYQEAIALGPKASDA